MRLNTIRHVFTFLFLLLALDLFYLQIIRGGYFARQSRNNSRRVISFDGPRGNILDRNGIVLAESRKTFDAAIIPQDSTAKGRQAIFKFLSGALGIESGVLERRYARGRASPYTPVPVLTGLDREQAILVTEGAFFHPGLVILEDYKRRYPRRDVGSHLLGYAAAVDARRMKDLINNGDPVPGLVGYTGVEEGFDEDLRGIPGGREVEVNSRGREVRVLTLRDPAPGADIVLTIDQRIQQIAYDVLGGRRGAFVMIDVASAEVVAMLSAPSFDPNAFSSGEGIDDVSAYLKDTRSPMINRAYAAAFQPGSVFKIPVSFGGLQERKITAGTEFDCPGFFVLGSRRYQFPHAFGRQDLVRALGHSANEFFFHTGFLLGPEKLAEYARKFGLGERTGIPVPYESKGNVPVRSSYRNWYQGDTANMSIGQGDVLSTPLQLARMMVALETRGRLQTPCLVSAVGSRGDLCAGAAKSARQLVFRNEVWDIVLKGLSLVVDMPSGTAHQLKMDGLTTYGKTGTAQTGAGREDHAWFAGVTRSSSGRFAYCFFLEHGGSSANAVSAVREILEQMRAANLI